MCELHAQGKLEIETDVFPLGDVAEAWRRQQASPGLKLALDPRS
jgi:hypothetical protein